MRDRIPRILIPAYADDIEVLIPPALSHLIPEIAAEFANLWRDHGVTLNMDCSKTFAASRIPLLPPCSSALALIGFSTQTNGIAPCKIPFGSPAFISSKVDKVLLKLNNRATELHTLWTALIEHSRSNSYADLFINIVRLCFSSIAIFYLRTLPPWAAAIVAARSDELLALLIDHIRLPLFLPHVPGGTFPTAFGALREASCLIEQLPLTDGGWSLATARSIASIAYASSCAYSLPNLRGAAASLGIPFSLSCLPDYDLISSDLSRIFNLPASFWLNKEGTLQLQKELSARLHLQQRNQILDLLAPFPHHSNHFKARCEPHASYCINSRARFTHGIMALNNNDYMRLFQLSTLSPAVHPGSCACGIPLDPTGLHYLCCQHIHYGFCHDSIKHALARALKRVLIAREHGHFPSVVMVELPVSNFYARIIPPSPTHPARIADIVIIHESNGTLRPLILDVVTATSTNRNPAGSCCLAATTKVAMKFRTYAAYSIPDLCMWPIAVERSGSIPPAPLSFFTHIQAVFQLSNNQTRSLIHALIRGVHSGVAQIFSHVEHRARIHACGNPFSASLLDSRAAAAKHTDARAASRRAFLAAPHPPSRLPPDPHNLALFISQARPELRRLCSQFALSQGGSCVALATRLAYHHPAVSAALSAPPADVPFDLFSPLGESELRALNLNKIQK